MKGIHRHPCRRRCCRFSEASCSYRRRRKRNCGSIPGCCRAPYHARSLTNNQNKIQDKNLKSFSFSIQHQFLISIKSNHLFEMINARLITSVQSSNIFNSNIFDFLSGLGCITHQGINTLFRFESLLRAICRALNINRQYTSYIQSNIKRKWTA